MILFVGLGNPGEEYQYTRHNIGFEVLEKKIIEWKHLLLNIRNKRENFRSSN